MADAAFVDTGRGGDEISAATSQGLRATKRKRLDQRKFTETVEHGKCTVPAGISMKPEVQPVMVQENKKPCGGSPQGRKSVAN